MKQPSLYENIRMTLDESIAQTALSIQVYAENHKHWVIAYSGGKDSSATLAVVLYLIETGQVKRPESLTVMYADTGLELLPLHHTAMQILAEVKRRGYAARIVRPRMDKRFFVYMFGRGVPPPSNWFRWCTGALKIEPMMTALKEQRGAIGEKFLSMIGVRLGESAVRDARIAIACGKGAECGQGYYQEATPGEVADVMAPIVHWRVCHVWDFLQGFGPDHGLPTAPIARIYGHGTEYEEENARTGCLQCPMPTRDTTLARVLKLAEWEYLSPLARLRPLYDELRKPYRRLRKTNMEYNADGEPVTNLHRLGPMTMETRLWGLEQVLEIQRDVNDQAILQGRPTVELINGAEEARIKELIGLNTWPEKWTGEELTGADEYDAILGEGVVQPLLIRAAQMGE